MISSEYRDIRYILFHIHPALLRNIVFSTAFHFDCFYFMKYDISFFFLFSNEYFLRLPDNVFYVINVKGIKSVDRFHQWCVYSINLVTYLINVIKIQAEIEFINTKLRVLFNITNICHRYKTKKKKKTLMTNIISRRD